MVTVGEKLYSKMPDDIKALFRLLPNPDREEVCELFPDTGQPCGTPKKTTHKDGMFGIGQPAVIYKDKTNTAARFFYCAKSSKGERNYGLEGFDDKKTNDGRNKEADNAFQRGKTLRFNHHPTVKPVDLMRYLVRLVTPPEGTVIDPFMGSGTTGMAAKLEGFKFIGIERDKEYFEIAKARIENITEVEIKAGKLIHPEEEIEGQMQLF